MKQLYSVFTHYQLLAAIQLRLTVFSDCTADIVISDHSNGYEGIAQRLRETGIFSSVYTAKSAEAMSVDTLGKKFGRVSSIAVNDNSFPKKCSNIECYDYDEFLFYNWNYLNSCLFYTMKKNNKNLVCRRFEEGYSSGFDYDIGTSGSTALQARFEGIQRNDSFKDSVREMFFYEPELVLFDKKDCAISSLPKIDKNDIKLRDRLNYIFDYKPSAEYDTEYIFFEDAYFKDGVDIDDMPIIMRVADIVGKDNLTVKLHPRTLKNRFTEYGIKTNSTVGIPWEIIIMNNDFSDKVFITIASGSVLSPRILFGENTKTLMLYKCTEKRSPIITDSFYAYLEKFKNKFGDSGLFIPQSCDEIERWL